MAVIGRRLGTVLGALAVLVVTLFAAGTTAANGATLTLNDAVLSNPSLSSGVIAHPIARNSNDGVMSGMLYRAKYSNQPWVRFRNVTTGAAQDVNLPTDVTPGSDWNGASTAFGGGRFWVLSGGGPVRLREWTLAGSDVPTSATLAKSIVLGNTDSRPGGIIRLASGAVVAVWKQQGATTAQALNVTYLPLAGESTTLSVPLQTMSSVQAVAQHPVDGSVWVFSNADAAGSIDAVRAVETQGSLAVSDVRKGFITTTADGANGPDGENPDLEAVADQHTGSIALAYQNNTRRIFSTSPWVVGSYVSIARISATGTKSFISMPEYVERISSIGLTVRGAETWLIYRPVNQSTLTYADAYVRRHDGATWSDPYRLGTILGSSAGVVYADPTQTTFGVQLTDGQIHVFSDGPVSASAGASSAPSTSTSTTSTTAPTTSTQTKGGGKRK